MDAWDSCLNLPYSSFRQGLDGLEVLVHVYLMLVLLSLFTNSNKQLLTTLVLSDILHMGLPLLTARSARNPPDKAK